MFKTLLGLMAPARPARTTAPAKVKLSVFALEHRDCPAVMSTGLAHDLKAALPPTVPDGSHLQPVTMSRMVRGLNPQPLPP